jgi:2-oxo-4-hydroxy-4-carboxy-5-ureidoimidazoline decarboxylase
MSSINVEEEPNSKRPKTNTMSQDDSNKPSVTAILNQSKEEIVAKLGGVYEHSAWVAEKLPDNRMAKIETVSELANKMKEIVDKAKQEKKKELLKAHPDLCQKVQDLKNLTKDSQEEQSKSDLQSLTEVELQRFTTFNTLYRDKFGFPFILAVRNSTKYTVLSALAGRLKNSYEREFAIAMEQVHKIAWMRLLQMFDLSDCKGYLTCHVLDTASGRPARNMRIELRRLSPPEHAGFVGEFVTNDDGRLDGGPALKGGKDFLVGRYEWTFYVADYFAYQGSFTSGMPFLDIVPIRFGIDNPDDHYHVPLLVSPWSYSTYRGS